MIVVVVIQLSSVSWQAAWPHKTDNHLCFGHDSDYQVKIT